MVSSGHLPISRLKGFKIHFVRDDVDVAMMEPACHLLTLHDDSVAVTSQAAAAGGDDPAFPRSASSFSERPKRIVSVIREHDRHPPLRARHNSYIRVMRM